MNTDGKVTSVEINENGELEVVVRFPSNSVYATFPAQPVEDRVVKQIYWAVDGRICLKEEIEGKVIPPQVTQERIEFER